MMRCQLGVSLPQRPPSVHPGFVPGASRGWIRAPALLTEAWTAAAWNLGRHVRGEAALRPLRGPAGHLVLECCGPLGGTCLPNGVLPSWGHPWSLGTVTAQDSRAI